MNMKSRIWQYKTSHEDETQSTISQLELKVTNDLFRNGHLYLRCTVYIEDVYRKSADIEITEDVPRIASITGESPPYDNRKYPSTSLRSILSFYHVVLKDQTG